MYAVAISIFKPNLIFLETMIKSIKNSFESAGVTDYKIYARIDCEIYESELRSILSNHNIILDTKIKRNLGFVRSYFYLMSKISEKYIFLADQDDIWEKSKVSEMIGQDFDIFISNSYLFQGEKNIGKTVNTKRFLKPELMNRYLLGKWNFYYAHNFLIKNSIFLKGIYDHIKHNSNIDSHDRLLVYLYMLKGKKIYFKNIALAKYRQHDKQLIGGFVNTSKTFLERISLNLKMYERTSRDLNTALKFVDANIFQKLKYNLINLMRSF